VEHMRLEMQTVMLSSYQLAGSGLGSEVGQEQFVLAVGKLGFDYTPQTEVGAAMASLHGGWDVLKNKPC